MTEADWQALWLTVKLAGFTICLLMVIGLPLAWWMARSRSVFVPFVSAIVALPLVLPPTVLGFYLLLAFAPSGPIGQFTETLGLGSLAFSFPGLVIGSMCYSLPFVVQPIQVSIENLRSELLESAATLGAGPMDRLVSVVLPVIRPGLITAAILGFAHTLGEFGVVLMIGGNIPGETRVLSVQLYDHVEALDYAQAHTLAAVLLVSSMCLLLSLNILRRRGWVAGTLLGSAREH